MRTAPATVDDPPSNGAIVKMRWAHGAFLAGARLTGLTGLCHLAFAHVPFVLRTPLPDVAVVLESMKLIPSTMSGVKSSLYMAYLGNSLLVGLLSMALSGLCVLVARLVRRHGLEVPRSIAFVGFLISGASAVTAVLYYPPPPMVAMSLASLCFLLATVLPQRAGRA